MLFKDFASNIFEKINPKNYNLCVFHYFNNRLQLPEKVFDAETLSSYNNTAVWYKQYVTESTIDFNTNLEHFVDIDLSDEAIILQNLQFWIKIYWRVNQQFMHEGLGTLDKKKNLFSSLVGLIIDIPGGKSTLKEDGCIQLMIDLVIFDDYLNSEKTQPSIDLKPHACLYQMENKQWQLSTNGNYVDPIHLITTVYSAVAYITMLDTPKRLLLTLANKPNESPWQNQKNNEKKNEALKILQQFLMLQKQIIKTQNTGMRNDKQLGDDATQIKSSYSWLNVAMILVVCPMVVLSMSIWQYISLQAGIIALVTCLIFALLTLQWYRSTISLNIIKCSKHNPQQPPTPPATTPRQQSKVNPDEITLTSSHGII